MNMDMFVINEMSQVGIMGQYTIIIESNDHNPPHFHVKLNNKTVTRIQIPEEIPTKVYDLVYVSNNATRLSSRVEKDLITWMDSPNKHTSKLNNLQSLQILWNQNHPDNEYIWN